MIQRVLEILFSLNRVSFTRHTRFGFGVDWKGWILPVAAVLVLVGWWSYQRQSVAKGRRLWLWLVRGLLLAVMFLLFCRPQLVLDREDRTRSVVAVWVDPSASMTLEDPYKDARMRDFVGALTQKTGTPPPGQTRLNRYQIAVGSLQDAEWLKSLAESQDVSIYSGSTHAQLLGTAHAPEQVKEIVGRLAAEKPTGETTDIPTVVQEILQSVQGTKVSALVLLTDGQTTEQGSRLDRAVAAAQRASAKVFALPLGQAQEPFNLKLTNLQVPEATFVRDPVAVKAKITGAGIDAATPVKVTLYRKEGEELSPLVSKEFTLDASKKQMDAELIFKPEKKNTGGDEKSEKFDLVAKVEAVGVTNTEELTLKDNEKTGHTSVLDAQINVLYVEGSPRWEFRYLKNELIRERTVNVSSLLLSADSDFPQEGDPRIVDREGREVFPGPITRFPESTEEMNKYDVLIIGDVEASYFSPSQQKLILDFVRQGGGGICWIAGPNFNPEFYKGTAMEPLMPVVPDEMDPRARVIAPVANEGFNFVLTAAGKESALFRFFDDAEQNARQISELPEMFWYKPVQGLKPAAEVLAVHPTHTQGGTPRPLIVAGRYGKGRTVFSAVCDTWRWRRYTGEPLFQSYWLQMCRLLYQGKALGQDHRIEMVAQSNSVEIGRPITVTMTVKDPSLAGQIPAKVPVMVMDKAGRALATMTLQRGNSAEGEQRLEGMTTASQVGELTLAVEPGLLPVEIPAIEMSVEPPQREFEASTADVESLGTLAGKTTGQVIPVYRAGELTKLVPDRSLPTLMSLSEDLWFKPIALVLVVGLATLEWLLRKRAGLI